MQQACVPQISLRMFDNSFGCIFAVRRNMTPEKGMMGDMKIIPRSRLGNTEGSGNIGIIDHRPCETFGDGADKLR